MTELTCRIIFLKLLKEIHLCLVLDNSLGSTVRQPSTLTCRPQGCFMLAVFILNRAVLQRYILFFWKLQFIPFSRDSVVFLNPQQWVFTFHFIWKDHRMASQMFKPYSALLHSDSEVLINWCVLWFLIFFIFFFTQKQPNFIMNFIEVIKAKTLSIPPNNSLAQVSFELEQGLISSSRSSPHPMVIAEISSH